MVNIIERGGYFTRENGVDYSISITPVSTLSSGVISRIIRGVFGKGSRTEVVSGVECLVREYDSGIIYKDDISNIRTKAYEKFKSNPTKKVEVKRVAAFPLL